MAGTAHSHWALWSTWRRGPDLLQHVAELVREVTGSEAKVRVLFRDDTEQATSGQALTEQITGQGLGGFRAILIEGGSPSLRARAAFVRSPTDVLVGEDEPRRARVRAGVMLEVTSTDPGRGADVARAKEALAAAIDRGRPRLVTREARHGQAVRREASSASGEPGSASRLLERNIRGWPPRSGFPVLFMLMTLAVYAGLIVLLASVETLYPGETLAWELLRVKRVVVGLGLVVAIASYPAQRWAFPAVEVATLTNLRRSTRYLSSTAGISAVVGFVLKIPGLGSLFD